MTQAYERALVTRNEIPRIVAHTCTIKVSIGKRIESPHSPGHRNNHRAAHVCCTLRACNGLGLDFRAGRDSLMERRVTHSSHARARAGLFVLHIPTSLVQYFNYQHFTISAFPMFSTRIKHACTSQAAGLARLGCLANSVTLPQGCHLLHAENVA
jgi:hypothetical protein